MAELMDTIPPEKDFIELAELTWDLAHEANQDYKLYEHFQSRVDAKVERYGPDSARGLFQGVIEARNKAFTRFEIKSQMAALVMRHPKCPFSTEAMRKFQEDILKNRGEINWGLASPQAWAVLKDYDSKVKTSF